MQPGCLELQNSLNYEVSDSRCVDRPCRITISEQYRPSRLKCVQVCPAEICDAPRLKGQAFSAQDATVRLKTGFTYEPRHAFE